MLNIRDTVILQITCTAKNKFRGTYQSLIRQGKADKVKAF